MKTTPRVMNLQRWVLAGAIAPLLFLAGVQLFILSEQTDVYFSWTIPSPFSASFLGAGYWAALVAAYHGFREGTWASIKTSALASVLAVTVMGVTTYIYLDRFHWASPNFITLFVTWVWVIVYTAAPPLLLIGWIVEARRLRGVESRSRPLPAWTRGGFFILASLFLLTGIGLFAMPETFAAFWPWKIAAFAGRAISAWLIAYGAAMAAVAFENDLPISVDTMGSLAAFSILQFIVIARYPASLNWGNPLAWAYLLLLLAGLIVNAAGLWMDRAKN